MLRSIGRSIFMCERTFPSDASDRRAQGDAILGTTNEFIRACIEAI